LNKIKKPPTDTYPIPRSLKKLKPKTPNSKKEMKRAFGVNGVVSIPGAQAQAKPKQKGKKNG